MSKCWKSFFTESILTKCGTSSGKDIQICSNEERCPFPRGDNFKLEIHIPSLKIFFFKTTGPVSTTKHPKVERTHGFTSNDHSIIFLPLINIIMIIIFIALHKCVYWLKLVSQVSERPMSLLYFVLFFVLFIFLLGGGGGFFWGAYNK